MITPVYIWILVFTIGLYIAWAVGHYANIVRIRRAVRRLIETGKQRQQHKEENQ